MKSNFGLFFQVYTDRTADDILKDNLTPSLIDHEDQSPETEISKNNANEIHIKALMEIAVLCNNASLGKYLKFYFKRFIFRKYY